MLKKTLVILLNLLFLNSMACDTYSDIFEAIHSVKDCAMGASMVLSPYKDKIAEQGLYINGYTPLHCAVLSQKVYIVRWLLKNGACIDQVDKLGETALDKALTHYNYYQNWINDFETLKKTYQSYPAKSPIFTKEECYERLEKLKIIIADLQAARS